MSLDCPCNICSESRRIMKERAADGDAASIVDMVKELFTHFTPECLDLASESNIGTNLQNALVEYEGTS